MLPMHYSLKVARKLLNAVSRKAPVEAKKVFTVKTYCNGREQGYALAYMKGFRSMAISFAQNRNSDSIVVYCGAINFNDIPTEETYRAAKYFDSDAMGEAVEYVLVCVKKVLENA